MSCWFFGHDWIMEWPRDGRGTEIVSDTAVQLVGAFVKRCRRCGITAEQGGAHER